MNYDSIFVLQNLAFYLKKINKKTPEFVVPFNIFYFTQIGQSPVKKGIFAGTVCHGIRQFLCVLPPNIF